MERFVGSHVLGVSKGLDVPTRVATCAGLERVRARGERQGDGSRSRGSALDRLIIRHFCTDSAGRKLHADEPACRNRVSYAIPRCGRRRGAVPPTSLDLAGSALMQRGTSVAAGGLPDDGSSRGIVARVFARLADVRSSMAGRPDALDGAGHTDGHERGTRP